MIALAAGPRPAQAQWGHAHIGVSVGFGYGWGPFYSPWYPYWGAWGGYGWGPYGFGIGFSGYPFYYPYYSYGYPIDTSGSVRLEVKPRDADVYVDGYLAGKVDNFDGVFQRLRVEPGGHELVVYKDGFHSVQQHLYLAPTSDQHVKFVMQPLGPGEAADARPVPIPREEMPPQDQPERPRYGRGGPPPMRGGDPQQMPPPDRGGPPPPDRGAPPPPETQPDARVEMTNPRSFGSVALVIQPADAEIVIDGQKWSAPVGQSRVVIQLPEGKHHIEIQKDGYAKYVEDIGVMRGRTMSLNVSLVKG